MVKVKSMRCISASADNDQSGKTCVKKPSPSNDDLAAEIASEERRMTEVLFVVAGLRRDLACPSYITLSRRDKYPAFPIPFVADLTPIASRTTSTQLISLN
jgi:hypothetical protein